MDADRFQLLEDIFHKARELPCAARESYLLNACPDADFREEVEQLLRHADGESGGRIGAAIVNARDIVGDDDTRDLWLGTQVGAYQIERQIGRGGFGTVYLARRVRGFDQVVAIKLLRQDRENSQKLLQRFAVERQILADLTHDNIARLLDGGTTEEGRPYLVMEYVEGTPINQFCKERDLALRDRLVLFQRVCQATAHAHQFGIIHRDLKPSNILVTPEGNPKLVDFGIAKIEEGQHDRHATALTQTGQAPLTPDYASPEQVQGRPVGQASDVYSLGIVLYELLCGRRPFELTGRSAAEVERIVCEQTPTRPSQMCAESTMVDTARSPSSVASSTLGDTPRSTQPRLGRSIRGDLDNIVLMALRKEPDRRYSSANHFSEDIQRYFDGLPVIAQRDYFVYRSRKFIRRNRVAVSAALIVIVSLVCSAIGITFAWQDSKSQATALRVSVYRLEMAAAYNEWRAGNLRRVKKIPLEQFLPSIQS